MKITHIITDLDIGGAEQTLYRVISHSQTPRDQIQIISIKKAGYFYQKLLSEDCTVFSLGYDSGSFSIAGFKRLIDQLEKFNPHIILTWMYHANLIGGLAARKLGIPVCWNIHHTALKKGTYKRMTYRIARICALLSHKIPQKIVACAQSAVEWHTSIGYDASKFIVIPNGFDTHYFKPNPPAGLAFRQAHHIPEMVPVVAHAGRFASAKDHYTFLRAAGRVLESFPEARFMLCGRGVDSTNAQINAWAREAGVQDRIILLGELTDMRAFYAAADLFALSSLSEAFPNVIGEAMSCGLPCVVTDVGDCAYIVGDSGLVVPPADALALAEAINLLLSNLPLQRSLGSKARQRIIEHFSMEEVVKQYEELLNELLAPTKYD